MHACNSRPQHSPPDPNPSPSCLLKFSTGTAAFALLWLVSSALWAGCEVEVVEYAAVLRLRLLCVSTPVVLSFDLLLERGACSSLTSACRVFTCDSDERTRPCLSRRPLTRASPRQVSVLTLDRFSVGSECFRLPPRPGMASSWPAKEAPRAC